MALARPKQKFQDWFTQQWVIFRGRKIDPDTLQWLMGPFGNVDSTADEFINDVANREGLIIQRNVSTCGLIGSVEDLNLSKKELERLSEQIIDFYENTSQYNVQVKVKWTLFFKAFGKIVSILFSTRIKQLNVPVKNSTKSNEINSEIITLSASGNGELKYTIWYRTFKSTNEVLYSGVYTTCTLPNGKACIKAIFPLPNGNATVIMDPSVGSSGELKLDSSGKKFGDPGFYFLVQDTKGKYWSRYIRSFRDRLDVFVVDGRLHARQTLTVWHLNALKFDYDLVPKDQQSNL